MEKLQIAALIDRYIAAWNEPDPATRRALLVGVWARDGVYTDPLFHAVGRFELDELIARFRENTPGVRFELEGKIDNHHAFLRFFWKMHLPDGSQVPGMDFGELAPDGKLARIVGFF